jgi:hypothetical protein
MMPVQTLTYKPNTPLRLLDEQTHAGFYSSGWGLIPFSFSQGALEEIVVSQVNFMVKALPWAEIETESETKPWPGYLRLQNEAPLAVLAKPGSQIRYRQTFENRMRLETLCGVSPDSYVNGSENSFSFVIRQLHKNGRILAESIRTLHPGKDREDRDWQTVEMTLEPSRECFLEFRYSGREKESGGTGAFAQAILQPLD